MNYVHNLYNCNNQKINAYTFDNDQLKATILDFGATVHELCVKEADGTWTHMAASYQKMSDYFDQGGPYLNAIVGPVAGRIGYGTYYLDGNVQKLSINNGANHLHGGATGVSKQFFNVEFLKDGRCGVACTLKASHAIDGFKGTFDYTIYYIIENNTLTIEYKCVPTNKTLLNMTNHLYFNLSGSTKECVMDNHVLQFACDNKLKLHKDGQPFKVEPIVKDGPFDFNNGANLKENFEKGSDEFAISVAFDTPFLLKDGIIKLKHVPTGNTLTINTDQKAVVAYSACWFDENLTFHDGTIGYKYNSIALETQDAPNGINIDEYEHNQIFSPEHLYTQKTSYTFTKE